MTYKDWCLHSKTILAQAEEYNKWQTEAKANLLTSIGPRIEKLRITGYMGCGFHYSMEQSFGKLLVKLALPWQPCANHCENVEKESLAHIIDKVIYESLIEQVEKAEKSI